MNRISSSVSASSISIFIHKALNCISLAILAMVLFGSITAFADDAKAKYMGVGSCSSSNCHGAQAPRQGNSVLQNEFVTWYKHDKHAKAFQVLGNDQSKRMAKHLGIADAQKEPACLVCHATYTTEVKSQGSSFQLEDGVGCESCHGAAEKWLGSHTARDATHEKNLKDGMVDNVSLNSRTKLCLSCHLGTDNQYVTHRIMGAGHPRLSFELDTFTAIQPVHWNIDEDYKKRKADYSPARAWLVGQVIQASEMVAAMQSEKRSKHGIMPELTLFSCFSCHHSLADDQWKSHDYDGSPGELRLNVSSPVMVRVALGNIDSKLAEEIDSKLKGIHLAFQEGKAADRLKSLKATFDGSAKKLADGLDLSEGNLRKMLKSLVEFGAKSAALQYDEAEQVAMGMSAVLISMQKSGAKYKAPMDAVYASLKNAKSFDGQGFAKACEAFLGKL